MSLWLVHNVMRYLLFIKKHDNSQLKPYSYTFHRSQIDDDCSYPGFHGKETGARKNKYAKRRERGFNVLLRKLLSVHLWTLDVNSRYVVPYPDKIRTLIYY